MKLGVRFYLFAISTALSGLVTHSVRFAVAWLVAEKTGNATLAAMIFGIASFVEIYARPLLAPIADYFVRLRVYRVCLALNVTSTWALFFAVAAFSFSAWLVGSLLVLSGLVDALRHPTAAGLTPSIVPLERLTEAQSVRSTIGPSIGVMAPALGGLLITLYGVSSAIQLAAWAASLAYVAALGVRVLPSTAKPKNGSWANYLQTWHIQTFTGIRAVFKTRAEILNAIATSFLNGGLFPFFSIGIALWVNTELHYGAWAMAVVEIAFWIGMLVSGAFLLQRLNHQLGRYMVTVISCFILGGCLILASQFKNVVVISAFFVMAGIAFTAFNVNTSALRSAAAPPEFRSRLFAGVSFIASGFNPFSVMILGLVISASSPSVGVAVCGCLIALSGVVIFTNKEARNLYMKPLSEIGAAYASLYPKAFRQ